MSPDPNPSADQASGYAYYVVAVLMVAYMFSFIDRMILSLVIDPVRQDLGLSETQVSLLVGFAFAMFYTLLGLPFGRWVDTRGRRNLIAFGIALWSLATIACGLANGFARLFLARMTVGVGEATLTPAAYSLIPDYFPPRRLGLAMSLYTCGLTIGGGLAMLLGGMVVQWATALQLTVPGLPHLRPWQVAFLVVGAPGLLVAALVALTVREPPRRVQPGADADAPSLAEVFAYLRGNAGLFAPLFLGFTAVVTASYSLNVWGPSYFMRVHGLTPLQVGQLFAVAFGVAGTVGVLAGGAWSDAAVRRGRTDAPLRVTLWSILLQAPFVVGFGLLSETRLAGAAFVFAMLFGSMFGGLQAAAVQSLTPNRMRGQIGAIYLTLANLIGLGIAPTLTALGTERLFGGATGVGRSIALTAGVSLALASVLLAIAAAPARNRIRALQGGT
ncbi:MFS transporter [Phenylobacterium sp.]|uniref:spinster family MFS transporter n=1 Tax=Phenylobacterium sp. TaxID=1871053 RepID=UPI00301BF4E4